MGTSDAIGNAVSVIAIVVIPLGLLWAMGRDDGNRNGPRRASAPPAGGEARIPLVNRSMNPIVASSFLSSKLMFGGTVPNSVRLMAHHPALLSGYGTFELATKYSHKAPARLKHLAELRAASLCGCEWCMDFGSAISEEAGVDEDDLVALPNYATSDRFSDLEKLVLDYATGMSRTPVEISDELFAKLAEQLNEAQLVELTSVIAIENYRARSLWAFGLEAQGYAENMTCVRPAEVPASAGA